MNGYVKDTLSGDFRPGKDVRGLTGKLSPATSAAQTRYAADEPESTYLRRRRWGARLRISEQFRQEAQSYD